MIWQKCKLCDSIPSGSDELGNPIVTLQETLSLNCRYTPYDIVATHLEGRTVGKDEQFFTLPIRTELLPTFTHLVLDRTYEVVEVIALPPRYTVVKVKEYENQD